MTYLTELQMMLVLYLRKCPEFDLADVSLVDLKFMTDLMEALYGDAAARDLVTATVARYAETFPTGLHPLSPEGSAYLREHRQAEKALEGTLLQHHVRAYMR